jgi:hypothetical protein
LISQSRGLGDVYKRQALLFVNVSPRMASKLSLVAARTPRVKIAGSASKKPWDMTLSLRKVTFPTGIVLLPLSIRLRLK